MFKITAEEKRFILRRRKLSMGAFGNKLLYKFADLYGKFCKRGKEVLKYSRKTRPTVEQFQKICEKLGLKRDKKRWDIEDSSDPNTYVYTMVSKSDYLTYYYDETENAFEIHVE
jgi:hypothetical protein